MPKYKKYALVFAGIIAYICAILMGIEIACQVAYRITANKWLFCDEAPMHSSMFEKHPYLVGVPRAGASVVSKNGLNFTHNSLGFRGDEIARLKDGRKRIIALGGSSTYCIGVSDHQTWPYRLEKDLDPDYEVINFGVPGYNTAENIIQTAFWLSDLDPDICVYYEGWNDMRNMHVKGLKADYSDFHGRSQHDNLVLYALKFGNRSAAIRFLRKMIDKFLVKNPDGRYHIEGAENKYTTKPDERALGIYGRNLKLIIELCRAQGVRPIMVPQVINREWLARDALTTDESFFWIPYVKLGDLSATIKLYNDKMREVCAAERADYIESILDAAFDNSCFYDYVHFSKKGNEKFAGILAEYIAKSSSP